ncbi:MAG: hypothetical protein ACE37F_27730 [Nannocystaceae bacterium]|nr:hypothetical protein [bacterium]
MTASSPTEQASDPFEAVEAEHQPHVDAWIASLGVSEGPGCNIYRSVAGTVLEIPQRRGDGRLPGEPEREPLTWDEIDAFELLFTYVIYGGCPAYDSREYLTLMGSFVEYLGEAGVIPAAEHAALKTQWGPWMERALDVWETGSWYKPDGKRISPEELRRANGETAARKPRGGGSRFGKFRRRTRSVRR